MVLGGYVKTFRLLAFILLAGFGIPSAAQVDYAHEIYEALNLDQEAIQTYEFYQTLTQGELYRMASKGQLLEAYRLRHHDQVTSDFSRSELEEILKHIQRYSEPPTSYVDWQARKSSVLLFGYSSGRSQIIMVDPGATEK